MTTFRYHTLLIFSHTTVVAAPFLQHLFDNLYKIFLLKKFCHFLYYFIFVHIHQLVHLERFELSSLSRLTPQASAYTVPPQVQF